MDTQQYLDRISCEGCASPTPGVLRSLQKAHLLSVPFENLDIHYKIPIELNARGIYEKVVIKRRGGFCYELNSLFGELLSSLGFNVKLISARVFNQERQTFSPEFDHLAVIVEIDSIDYLADVGFGEFAFAPLKVETTAIQGDQRGAFIIERSDDPYYKVAKRLNGNWIPEYMFTLKERDLNEFREMCNYHQTSPLSHFTQNKFCSLATEKGRITVTRDKIKITEAGMITELSLKTEDEFLAALEKYFHIRINDNVPFPNTTPA